MKTYPQQCAFCQLRLFSSFLRRNIKYDFNVIMQTVDFKQ